MEKIIEILESIRADIDFTKEDKLIDDGILDIGFKVLAFECVFFDNMGNAVPIVCEGSAFSQRQKDTFRRLARNRRFYISRVKAIGPDGIERLLPTSMEVIVK